MAKKRTKSNNKNLPLNENEREELERLRNENETLKAGIAYQKKLLALTDIWKQQSEKIKVIKALHETYNRLIKVYIFEFCSKS